MRTSILLVGLFVASALLLSSGCRQSTVEVVQVEVAKKETTGRNLAPLKARILEDAERAVDVWIEGDATKLPDVFTERMMGMWREARALDSTEGVSRVRAHSGREFVPTTLSEANPRVRYEFTDESYFADEATGEARTAPYGVEREIVLYFVEEDGVYKIDNMVGSDDGLR